ncbi:MAG TPA: polyketide cyclase, partial [Verrucomicrobiae bacterium]|nr:polyketide cyclase [Verrucomicrobiae bacterium]
MKSPRYTFVTTWHVDAPLEEVWLHLIHIEAWPTWWKGVEEASILSAQNIASGGVGSQVKTRWRSWLPYSISFVLTIREVQIGKYLIADSKGDLDGTGTWEFSENNGTTIATYTWDVHTTKPWMNVVAP